MRYIKIVLILITLLMPILSTAQVGGISASAFPRQLTVAQLPVASSGSHGMRIVTDGANVSDCTVGGGSTIVVCIDSGSTWTALGSGSGSGVTDHGLLTGLGDDDHLQYHTDSRAATWLLLQSIAWSQLTGLPDLATQAELDTHESNANIHHTPTVDTDTGPVVDCSGIDAQLADGTCVDITTQVELNTHESDANAHHIPTVDTDNQNASEVEYDNTISGLTAVEVQSAIDEIVNEMPSGGANPDGSGSELQYRAGATTFGAVTSSAVSGADVTLGGRMTVAPGAAATPGLTFTQTGSPGFYSSGAFDVTYAANGNNYWRFRASDGKFGGYAIGTAWMGAGAPSATTPNVGPANSDPDTGIGLAAANELCMTAGGACSLKATTTGTTITDVLTITPRASAPASCAIGDFYVDTSGAYCACSITNTWERMNTIGSCV